MSGRKWTEAEDAVLRAEYSHARREKIARRLGRTARAVCKRAYILGLTKVRKIIPPKPDLPAAERAMQAAERVERQRRENADRIAGCPLERWLASRENIMIGRNFGGATGHCKCCRRRQKFREAA